MEVPFWALSPSPFSVALYGLLAVWGAKQLLKMSTFQTAKYKRIAAWTDALFILGFIVVLSDTLWITVCAIRFLPTFPESLMQVLFTVGRNFAAMFFCLMIIGHYFKTGIARFNRTILLLFLFDLGFMLVWFAASPSPAYTDWTFAIRNDYPLSVIVGSFLVSHVVGRAITGSIYYFTLFRKP